MNKKNQIGIIQASAGSGKTYTLTEEVYKAIKTGIARPGSLLVTTFTKKAAAELTGKVTAKLVAEGMREAANEIRQAYIGTVNSVCARLLREYAFERGLSFRQQVLDEDEEKRLYTEALSRTFSKDQAGITLEKDIGDVCQRLDLGNWRELVSSIAQASRLNRVSPQDLEQWAQTSQKLLFKGITLGIDQHPELVKETKLAADRLAELITTGEDTTKKTAKARQTLQQFLAVCSRAGPVQWKEYVALAGLSAGLKSGANGLLDKVRSLAGTHYQWPGFKKDLQSCIRLLYTAAARSLYGFAELKARSGWVDFVDQEVLCLEALGSSQVQQSLSERLDMVFVDEFQDTSPIQLSLFLKLASLAKASVWVGDPKQSIYGFRDTDPDLMLAALSRLIKGAPETILDRSFRSRPELVTFVNHSFKDTFHAQDLEPAQVVLKPERQDRIKFPALESWVLDKQVLDGRPQQNKNSDTQALALQVKRLLEEPDQHPVFDKRTGTTRPIQAGDIAILARTNDTCRAVAAHLSNYGVPAEVGIAGLLQEPGVILCTAGLRLIADPEDSLAAAQLSYLFRGLEETEYQSAWLTERLKEKAARKEGPAWYAYPRIQAICQQGPELSCLSPCEVLHRIMELVDVWNFCCSSDNPRRELAHVEQLAFMAADYEQRAGDRVQGISLAGFLEYLAASAKAEEDEKALVGSKAVRVLTIYKAKGLEWPLVILFELDKSYDPAVFGTRTLATSALDLKKPLGGRGVVCWPSPYGRKEGKAAFTELVQQTHLYQDKVWSLAAEEVRLVYVALTRARDYLVFAARPGKTASIGLLQDKAGKATCTIPQDPARVPDGWVIQVPVIDEASEKVPETEGGYWFTYAPGRTPDRRPGTYSASKLLITEPFEPPIQITYQKSLDTCLEITDTDQFEQVGNTLHSYLALNPAQLEAADKKELAVRIIAGYEMEKIINPENLVSFADGFNSFVQNQWPGAACLREWPIQLDINGTRISGEADLVLKLPEGMVVLDYKTFTGTEKEIQDKAVEFAGQISVYAEAVSQALNKKVRGTYIVFPTTGIVAQVTVINRPGLLKKSVQALGT